MTVAKIWDGSGWVPVVGAQGPMGPPGLSWEGAWDSGTVYHQRDVVEYQGSAWVANQTTTGAGGQEPGGAYGTWDLLASKGATGAPATATIYSTNIGNGSLTVFTITHNLGKRNVIVCIYRNSTPYDEVDADVEHTDLNTVTIRTPLGAPTTNQYTVVVLG